jgi:hypothetical protein
VAYDTTALVASVKRRASVPTTQATISVQDFLDLANEELQSYVVPLLLEAKSEYLVTETDYSIDGSSLPAMLPMDLSGGVVGSVRIPTRAIGGKLREVQFVDARGLFTSIPQITVDQLQVVDFGFYVKGNVGYIWSKGKPLSANWRTIRLSHYQRPSDLVYPAAAGVITGMAGTSVTLASVPTGFTSSVYYDLVRAQPGFETLSVGKGATVAGSTLTFASLPPDLTIGDYVCLAGQSPVPQIPAELHPLLAQAITVKVLQAIGDDGGMQAAMGLLARLERDARNLIAQRIDGEPLHVVAHTSLFRSAW